QRVYWKLIAWPVVGAFVRSPVEGAKRFVRRVVAPEVGRVEETIRLQVAAIAGLREGLEHARHDVAQVAAAVAGLRDAVAAVAAESGERAAEGLAVARQVEREIRAQAARIDFVRQETLFELRTRDGHPSPTSGVEVVDATKLEAMRAAGTLRVNV